MTWESHEFFRDGAGWTVSHHQGRPARLMKSWWPVSARCCRRYFSAPGLILHAAALEIHGQTPSKGIEQSFISFIMHHYYYYYFIIISNYFIYVYMHAFIKIYLIPSLYIMIYTYMPSHGHILLFWWDLPFCLLFFFGGVIFLGNYNVSK